MNKFITFLMLSVILCMWSNTDAQDIISGDDFIINGTTSSNGKGTLMLSYYIPDTLAEDSVEVNNGKFRFAGSVSSPVRARLYFKGDRNHALNFFLENSTINIVLNKDSIERSKVSGSVSNIDFDSVEALLAPYYEALGSLRKVRDFASKQHLASVLKSVDNIYDGFPGAQRKLIVDYALSHPDSYAITTMLSINFTNNQTELSVLKKVYNHFSDPVKQSAGGQDIAALIKRIERVQIGNKAPGFSLPDQHGKMVALSSFKGKYVLLDFWASWCVPCRAESPNLVKAYEKYKDKNFTIVGISLDVEKDRQKWLDAVQEDGMVWTNLSSLKGYEENGVRQLYSVQGIPDNFLISPEGKIIARGLRGADLDRKLQEIIE